MLNTTEKDILARHINNIIEKAVYYGGDSGGAYFSKEYYDALITEMKGIKNWRLPDYEIAELGDLPMFVKLIKEEI